MAKVTKKTTAELKRARILRERRLKLKITGWTPEESSIVGRTAEFLDYCAQKYPHSLITYEEITQAIYGLGRLPMSQSQNVKSVRGQMSSAGKRLMRDYNRTLVTERGVGARASVDNADKLRESVTKAAERHKRSADHLQSVCSMVDPKSLEKEIKELKGDPVLKEEMLELSRWLTDSMGKYLKSLDRPAIASALLPPPPSA